MGLLVIGCGKGLGWLENCVGSSMSGQHDTASDTAGGTARGAAPHHHGHDEEFGLWLTLATIAGLAVALVDRFALPLPEPAVLAGLGVAFAAGGIPAAVAALFAIMTKVGIYTVLRLWTLLFSGQAGASAYFGGDWLIYGGMATIVCAALAILIDEGKVKWDAPI